MKLKNGGLYDNNDKLLADSEDNIYFDKQNFGLNQTVTSSASMTVDCSVSDIFNLTMPASAATIYFTNPSMGSITLVVTHNSSSRVLTFDTTSGPQAYHINTTGAKTTLDYTLNAGATFKTIFQVFYDGTSYYIMSSPFYLVVA
jgi:hypothetical protein